MARKDPPVHQPERNQLRETGLYTPSASNPPRKPKRRLNSKTRVALIAAAVWLLFGGGIVFSYWLSDLPDTRNLFAYEPGNDISVLDAKGRMIARRGLTSGEKVAMGELPAYVGNAFIAVEDRRFRYHFGIDPMGLMRAAYTDLIQGSFVQGGSTLTQQLAKNLFLKPDRTFSRKMEEAILAVYLETRYSKDEILTLYLNRVYFGAGVYGLGAASERFFAKPARELSLTEAAILAGSVKAPSRYNPEASPDAALARAELVLAAMEENGFIDHRARQVAASTRPKIAHSFATPGAGYFVDYVVSQVSSFIGKSKERLIVDTTLDLGLQLSAENALTAGLAKDGPKLAATQGALVAMAPDGALRALVGGRSYDDSAFNRATEAKRQPGSAFKAFVYLAALENGHRPDDEVVDGPVTIGTWKPANYEGAYEGAITLSHALAHSSNSASVQLTNEVGPDAVVRVAHRLGVSATLHAVPSLALGTSEVTPLELTTGYAAFANGGNGIIPYGIVRIRTASGKVLYQRREPGLGRVMSPEHDADMTEMMMGTVKDGTGKAAALSDRPVAGKTGTSQDYRDAWFVGFSAEYVTCVWIGNDNGASMKTATGGGLPARVFKAFMSDAERGLPAKPLIGMTLFGTEEPPGEEDIPEPPKPPAPKEEHDDVLTAFQHLLDKLF
ncbi:MAG: penicillin-binding protein [Alphaproteobacteria bacterium]|jgi:penicillin-binding protein 1A|nr:penicillin-binding protein [Alphaproteobacteria bacterium]